MTEQLRNVRAVLFDAVGTIMTPDPAVSDAYLAVGKKHGSELTRDEVSKRFSVAFRNSRTPTVPTNENRERETWRQIVADVFSEVADPEPLFCELWDHFADPAHWRVYDDVKSTWKRLHKMGLVLGIGSNFDERLTHICKAHKPFDACAHLFWSAQLQVRKPNRLFFDRVAETIGVAPENVLMIGDDIENDYCGARQAGWQSLLITRKHKKPVSAEVPVNHTIDNLDQVVELLAPGVVNS